MNWQYGSIKSYTLYTLSLKDAIFEYLSKIFLVLWELKLSIRVRHRGAVPPGLKKSNLAEFSQGETEKSYLNPEFRGAGVEAVSHLQMAIC